MKRLTVVLLLVAAALLVLSGFVSGASGQAGLLSAYAVTVHEQAPVLLTVGIPIDGEIITATVPLTIGIDLRITVDGAIITTTAPSSATITVAPVAAGAVDSDGRIVEYDVPPTMQIDQVRSDEDSKGRLRVLGEITNIGVVPAQYVRISIMMYDAAGVLLATSAATTGISTIAPGQSTSFEIYPTLPAADVARYKIQIEHN